MRHSCRSRHEWIASYKRHVWRALDSALVHAAGVTPANAPEALVGKAITADLAPRSRAGGTARRPRLLQQPAGAGAADRAGDLRKVLARAQRRTLSEDGLCLGLGGRDHPLSQRGDAPLSGGKRCPLSGRSVCHLSVPGTVPDQCPQAEHRHPSPGPKSRRALAPRLGAVHHLRPVPAGTWAPPPDRQCCQAIDAKIGKTLG
jgi:hypothetical protein